ncbi:CidA/LrgA family protein [Alkalihalobacillus pseudalcaliphilus]|uniref:CidA/LrgA family protein n=1 Tax=Alkalihalobacillus pseudalcaliphilus TaxID=79884 RepID=UPI00064DE80F|nr:CidA/LrgA family protein [Alkalihalobacillus pseudalcaliphilus]KMK77825.1 hypothetical protein AB990_05095 [Alkalihalobacillus pseudalcaliphilus]
MKLIFLVGTIGLLVLYYGIGSWIHQNFIPFVPGSLIGMLLMFVTLIVGKDKLYNRGKKGASLLIMYLPLFFVPVTVGIIEYSELLSGVGLFLSMTLLLSTIVVLTITSLLIEKSVKNKGVLRERDQ